MDIIELAEQNQQNAWKLLDETGIIPAWERIGATVHLVGSLKSGLLMKSRDIDLHIYTGKLDITESFSVMQELAERLKGEKIIVNAVDPGVVDTGIITMHRWFDPIVDWIFRPIIRTPAQGVERTLLLVTDKVDCNQSGIYWGRYRPVMISPTVLNNPYRWRLWNDTEKIVSKWL